MAEQHYLVTARKYRPALFGELLAQRHVTETLRNAIQLDRLAHSYLFCGPRGVGKTTAARILAKAINCTDRNKETAEPCRACVSCKDFETGRSLNIFEIDAASNNKVEDVRELRETVHIPPQGSLKKVYIIDEVHMLSNAAFNALLKTLEEPPPHVLFIFATTEPHKVLPTILSRCQRFDFRRIPVPDIVGQLQHVAKHEDVISDEESLLLLARKGDGSLRDALSAFDQAVALCGAALKYNELANALRVVDIDLYFEATSHCISRDSAGMLRLVEKIVTDGLDLLEYLTGLAEHLRNLLVVCSMEDTALIEASKATKARYRKAAPEFTQPVLLRMLMIIDDASQAMAHCANPRLKLELALLKIASITNALSLKKALAQLDRLEQMAKEGKLAPDLFRTVNPQPESAALKLQTGRTSKSATTPRPPTLPPATSTNPSPPLTAVSIAPRWQDFAKHVRQERIQIGVMLAESQIVRESKDRLTIGVGLNFNLKTLRSAEKWLKQQFQMFFNTSIRHMDIVLRRDLTAPRADAQPNSRIAAQEYLEQQRKKNPVVNAILEQFGGELVW